MKPAGKAGLTNQEAEERKRNGLSNRLKPSAFADYAVILSRHLFTLFNFVVVPTAGALLYYGDWRSCVSVTGTALVNTIIGLFQEWRAKVQLDRLAILNARKARVIREGVPCEIPVDEIVLDDWILLRSGETVVADGTLIEANYLEVDEALLTGESDPAQRKMGDRVLSGSICVTGEGLYRADKVGDKAFANNVTADARRYRYTSSPITIASNWIIFVLSVIAFLLCVIFLSMNQLGMVNAEVMFQMIAATIVSMVPQGLVLTATISFTIGAVVMGQRGAMVQRLNAIEAMAAVDIICTDKTGTLTSNRLRLTNLYVLDQEMPESEIRHRLALFASASIDQENKNIQAIRMALGTVEVEVIGQIPFNARHRYSAVRVRSLGLEYFLVLGAPEALVSVGTIWDIELTRLQNAGLRVLLFAEAGLGTSLVLEPGILPAGLNWIALVALGDELRPDAAEVLRSLSGQGISFKAISGDNPRTVRATIQHLDLPMSMEPVVSGADLNVAPDLIAFVRAHSVFGRVEPLQKVAIIEALQKGGANVAMIGDGVNDVLPIKKADLGIAMGEGSQAAKTVSSLVLENNDFSVLPEAIAEGRTIVRNLRRAGKLFITKNVYSLVFILAYAFGLLDVPFPYLPQQVSLLNWMTIGIPALLIAFTRERSTAPEKVSFLADVCGFAFRNGLIIAFAGLILLILSKHIWGFDEMTQRTMLLSLLIPLGMTVLWKVFGGSGERLAADHWLRRISLIIIPAFAIAMYWPLAGDFFELTPLGWREWWKVMLVMVPSYGFGCLVDYFFRNEGVGKKDREKRVAIIEPEPL